MKWLTKTLQYPASAKENQLSGTVNITFIINVDGSVSDVPSKWEGTGAQCRGTSRTETMGTWKPGIAKNKPCRSIGGDTSGLQALIDKCLWG